MKLRIKQPHARANWLWLSASAWLALGCTNGLLSQSTSAINSGSYTSSTDSNAAPPFTIVSVVKDTNNPSTILDLVGDGSGSMGNYCPQGSGAAQSSSSGGLASSSTSAATACNCVLTYSVVNPESGVSTTQSYEAYTVYSESDLIECDYSAVPSGVTAVTVDIHLTSSNAYSNKVNVTIEGNYGSVDVANIGNFGQANRWQCDELVTVNTVTSTIYDPIQSVAPHLFYPIDFYATNFGWTLAQYAQASQGFQSNNAWSCPQNPRSASLLADTSGRYNMRTYSVADLAGVAQIFPPQPGQFDRSNFFLANVPTGVFTMPMNAYIAPTVITSDTSPVGYGAYPIPGSGGKETCPTTATIPAGFHFVKVWLFRADLQPRTYLQFQPSAITALGNIMCNPSDLYTCDPTTDLNQCMLGGVNERTDGAYQCGPTAKTLGSSRINGLPLAARVLGTTACVSDSPGTGATANNTFGQGTDFWSPLSNTTPADPIASCAPFGPTQSAVPDPLDLCPAEGGGANGAAPSAGTIVQNYDGANQRYDYLFVVSPVTVNSVDMLTGSVGQSYTPYRFISGADCQADDPNAPPPGTCNPANIIHYNLKLHDVSSNGDPPAGTARAPVFPVCAIQPN